MISTHTLVTVFVATALAAGTSTAASADETPQPADTAKAADSSTPPAASPPAAQTTTKKKAKQSTQASGTKKASSGTSSKAKETADTKDATVTKDTSGTKDSSDMNAIEKFDKGADESAASANEGVVGAAAHKGNQQRAEDPSLRPKDDREAKKAAVAVGRTTTTAAAVVATAVEDTTRVTDKPGSYEPFAIEINPLAVVVGRYSAQIEWVPVTHHAVILNGYFVHTSSDIAVNGDIQQTHTFSGGGGELGYRYYTGHRGMNGVFIGPSFLAGGFNASLPGGDQTFSTIGGAVDIGAKWLVADHLTLGGGVGIQYLHVSHDFGDLPTNPAAIAASGVKARLLFEAGYAF